MKVHLHHSHVTGKITGYFHDFCHTTVVEKTSPDIPVIADNLFGFDLYYFIKGCIASALCSKSLNIAGNNLAHLNFRNIAGEIKFIESLKFYQKSLAELASTLSVQEKLTVVNNKFFQSALLFFYCLALFEFSKKRKNIRNCV